MSIENLKKEYVLKILIKTKLQDEEYVLNIIKESVNEKRLLNVAIKTALICKLQNTIQIIVSILKRTMDFQLINTFLE